MSFVLRRKEISSYFRQSLNKWQAGSVGLFGLLFTLLLIGASVWIFYNRQVILDQLRLLTFRPSNGVLQLATDDTMVGRGHDLYLASEPQIDDRASFNRNCAVGDEKTIVLGCYSAQRIYIYNVTDPRLDGIQQVTAAHEMLHAAYERLGTSQRMYVDSLINQELSQLSTDKHLSELIGLYNKQEPGELLNEMHSVLGTEYGNLSPALEVYYKQYFSDRAKIVAYAHKYGQVFTNSQNQLATLDAQLMSLKTQIDANNAALASQQAELAAERNQLNALVTADKISDYNNQVPVYNQKVIAYNALVTKTKDLVNQYNSLVDIRNQEAAAQNNLYQSINSHYQQTN